MNDLIPATACVGFRAIESAGGAARVRTFGLIQDGFLPMFAHHCIASDHGQGEEPFNRSRAKNFAAMRALGFDNGDPDAVLVFCDSDTYAPYHQVAFAVEAVSSGSADICFAHNGTGVYMSAGAVRGNGLGGIFGPFPGGIFAIRRSNFNEMGGWDEKFVGWGHEDLCFLITAERIFGNRVTMSNHPSIGPFFKVDLLYPRVTHEGELMEDTTSEAGRLYAANTRRRDAYIALAPGDVEGYWALRERNVP
jgi:hypothetical protein